MIFSSPRTFTSTPLARCRLRASRCPVLAAVQMVFPSGLFPGFGGLRGGCLGPGASSTVVADSVQLSRSACRRRFPFFDVGTTVANEFPEPFELARHGPFLRFRQVTRLDHGLDSMSLGKHASSSQCLSMMSLSVLRYRSRAAGTW
ncbi:MAG: hypothetical protein Ct9H300mP1_36120 [Planctomycetaceae bacterium]|nr:MAG: hypothetical protein Ct9H300mP1_36120 [Planctomycetaceae bacterium]